MDMTLSELAESRTTVEAYIGLGVGLARQRGETWARIAEQLGVSPQEAHRRYRWHDRRPTTPSNLDSPVAGP
jgi:hypothetical protein